MDRDGFDDVMFHIVEEPEEPRPRRPQRVRRWALAVGASVVVAGGLAAGASALTGSDGNAKAPSAKSERGLPALGDRSRFHRGGRLCHRHDRSGRGDTAVLAPVDAGSY